MLKESDCIVLNTSLSKNYGVSIRKCFTAYIFTSYNLPINCFEILLNFAASKNLI